MQPRDPASPAFKRAVVISPSVEMVGELEPLLSAKIPGIQISPLNFYPAPRELMADLAGADPPLVFLDAATDSNHALQLLTEVSPQANVAMFALLAGDDPDLMLRCLRAGASDFLLRPFTADQIESVLAKLARQQPADAAAAQGPTKIVAVMPAKGACGATTIACNLAFYWKRMGAKRVLLADLDPLTGTLSFLLKIKSIHSFLDVLQRSHELDADLWRAMVTNVGGVDVLLAPEMVTDTPPELIDPTPVLDYARHNYDVVVIDSGSVYGDWNLNQARAASEVLLVSTNELPALQAAQRALSYLDSNRIGRWKIRLVVNRYHREVGISREVIGTALHTEVFESLPSDYDAVQKALMEGKPVVSSTPFGKSMSQLAERLAGPVEKVEEKKKGGLGGLLGLFSKTK
jgi:pilus assembly protein CpaE